MNISADNVIYAIDLFGTASFAFSGALRVIHKRPDFVGMLILAGATAVGGSVLRDLLLQRELVILRDWGYSLAILISSLVAFFFPTSIARREGVFRYFDAVGLGVFSAITAKVTFGTPGINPLAVLYMATITGCAGGVIRDVLINQPSLVLSNEVYVTPVILGSAALMVSQWLGASAMVGFVTAMLVTTTIRCMAIRWNWRLPRLPIKTSNTGDSDKSESP